MLARNRVGTDISGHDEIIELESRRRECKECYFGSAEGASEALVATSSATTELTFGSRSVYHTCNLLPSTLFSSRLRSDARPFVSRQLSLAASPGLLGRDATRRLPGYRRHLTASQSSSLLVCSHSCLRYTRVEKHQIQRKSCTGLGLTAALTAIAVAIARSAVSRFRTACQAYVSSFSRGIELLHFSDLHNIRRKLSEVRVDQGLRMSRRSGSEERGLPGTEERGGVSNVARSPTSHDGQLLSFALCFYLHKSHSK